MTRRTTLRPISTPPDPPVATPPPPPPQLPARGHSKLLYVVGGLVAVGVVTFGALSLFGNRPSSADRTVAPEAAAVQVVPVAATAPVLPVSLPTARACPSVANFRDVMVSDERQAKWGLAASTAQTALGTPALCASDRSALAQELVSVSREALFEQPPAPEDAPGQRRVVAAYSDLKALANQYGVQQPAPLPIAQSAYDNRLFLLATSAYADAFAAGDASTDDRTIVRADYAAHYNLGLIWATRSDPSQRQDGLTRLATACRINEQLQLGSPEACNELQTLVGPRTRWPSPAADPLINPTGPTH